VRCPSGQAAERRWLLDFLPPLPTPAQAVHRAHHESVDAHTELQTLALRLAVLRRAPALPPAHAAALAEMSCLLQSYLDAARAGLHRGNLRGPQALTEASLTGRYADHNSITLLRTVRLAPGAPQ
jgi:hypothetical protein